MRRLVIIAIAVLPLFLAAYTFSQSQAPGDPLADESSDKAHGNIEWSSRANANNQDWDYHYEVGSREKSRFCRTYWDVVKWKTHVPPGQIERTSRKNEDGNPRKVDTFIRYNGGPAAGEAKDETVAWIPNDRKAQRTVTELQITAVVNKTAIPLDITASSIVKPGRDGQSVIQYYMKLSPRVMEIPEGSNYRISSDTRFLLMNTTVEWTSIDSPKWSTMMPEAFKYGWISDGKLGFDKQYDDDRPIHVFDVQLPGESRPKYSSGVLAIRDIESGEIVAQGSVPAYIFAEN